jgi:1,4-alpha-glucan branching enzyme
MRVVLSTAAALAALVSASCATTMTPAPPSVTPAGVRFMLMRAEASSVAVAGSFNQWSASSHPLARAKAGGLWTIVVPLPPGEHAFMYVVDGKEWVSPPLAEDYVDDGFGAKNGIVVVR